MGTPSPKSCHSEAATIPPLKRRRPQPCAAGDALALYLPLSPDSVALYLAAVVTGCVVVSVADSFSSEELRTRLDIAGAVGVFTQVRVMLGGRSLENGQKVQCSRSPGLALYVYVHGCCCCMARWGGRRTFWLWQRGRPRDILYRSNPPITMPMNACYAAAPATSGLVPQDVVLRGGKALPLYDKVVRSGSRAVCVVLPAAGGTAGAPVDANGTVA